MPIGTAKAVLMDEQDAKRAVTRMAYEILERSRGAGNTVIIGIQKKGAELARTIIKRIYDIEGVTLPAGSLDITFYRDDLTRLAEHPIVRGTDIPFAIEDKNIVLVDDVIYSGRTIRAAIESIFDMGRPQRIQLAVLVDRGGRELPIQPDFTGMYAPASGAEYINADLDENGELKRVTIHDREVRQ